MDIGLRESYLLKWKRELFVGLLKVLRHDLDISKDGHKVDIPCPSRDNVEVDVFIDTGSCNPPHIHTYVEPLRLHCLSEYCSGCLNYGEEAHPLFPAKVLYSRGVPQRIYEKVAVAVRVPVEHNPDEVISI